MTRKNKGEPRPGRDKDYRTLPERTRLTETMPAKKPHDAPDPTLGRDPDLDFLLRYGG